MSLPNLPRSNYFIASTGSDCFTEKQMQAYGQACREVALEEAAQVCDERANGENDAQYCANRIRSLK